MCCDRACARQRVQASRWRCSRRRSREVSDGGADHFFRREPWSRGAVGLFWLYFSLFTARAPAPGCKCNGCFKIILTLYLF